MKDVSAGKFDSLDQFASSKLDVLSLAQIKQVLSSQKKGAKSDELLVIDHIADQLQYVANSRREELTLGEFLERHHHLSGGALAKYSANMLKSQIEKRLGEVTGESAAVIDSQLGGVISHPAASATQADEHLVNAAYELESDHVAPSGQVTVDGQVLGANEATARKVLDRAR